MVADGDHQAMGIAQLLLDAKSYRLSFAFNAVTTS